MRLQKIKLVGFKSFVDATSIELPGQLIAIVGPNGCGKSNIIDAVRWVMGESSPKQLRGENATDVIFNGSSLRQPVGLASVELIFDNSDHTVTGQYAQFTEISIKRQVNRDSQSTYFLNGTKCRKRDIADVFLGSGLGPRSYSIIGQGTVSRLIDAKPEELRVYLEEAAGISKYKERRRETENRMRHTRENLERLTDIRDELEKQLNHLERQAQAAERYKVLKEEERVYKAQLLALRWQDANTRLEGFSATVQDYEVAIEKLHTEQQHIDTEVEKQREFQIDYKEQFETVQSEFYGIGTEIARVEQSLQHQQERVEQLHEDQHQATQATQEVRDTLTVDQELIVELSQQMLELEPQAEETTLKSQAAQEELLRAEEAQADWQSQWDEFNELAATTTQQAQVSQTKITHLEEQILTTRERLEKLRQEQSQYLPSELDDAITELRESIAMVEEELDAANTAVTTTAEQLQQQRSENQQLTADLHQAHSELQSKQGKFASLEALQQSALGQDNKVFMQWLEEKQLADKPRLAQDLQVDSGWEQAVETILGLYLEAVCVDGLQQLATELQDLEQGNFCAVARHVEQAVPVNSNSMLTPLSSKIQSQLPVQGILSGIYVANSVADALAMQNQLQAHESIVTQDGVWLGRGWLRVQREQDARQGIISREQELKALQTRISELESNIVDLEQRKDVGEEKLLQFEAEREQQQQALSECNNKRADFQAKLQVKQNRHEQLQQRQDRLQTECQENELRLEDFNGELMPLRETWQIAMEQMQTHADRREQLQAMKEDVRGVLDDIRLRARQEKDAAHQLALQLQSVRGQLDSAKTSVSRLEQQLFNLDERREELLQAYQDAREPLPELQEQLETMLQNRLHVEERLQTARQQLETVEQQLRQMEERRHEITQMVEKQRDQLQAIQMEWQSYKVRRTTLEEQLQEANENIEEVLQGLPDEADVNTWDEHLQRLANKIQRLGAINLAAIEEYDTQSERKTYLDTQNDDLVEALTILENAIKKIDNETRTRFKETFDHVNEGFKAIFPKVFGGGSAYLELTGEDLLDTGVAVMARPPGKKNSTIHLLSGGEKAMTAISLVFSIFQLNPAPFCLLDEVDAPLDDANVTRFCNLVKEMSERVQFLFISHNKLAMEMADYLLGITMSEPGVSRLVAVDVEEAMAMAE